MTHNRETARADARTPEGLWICRICRGLWTAVDEYAHTRPQPPWETSPVTHRVTPDVSHSSLGIPVRNHWDSHSYTAPTTVGWSTLLSQAGRTTETNEAGHLNTRKSPRVASLRTLSTFARNHCPPSSEYARSTPWPTMPVAPNRMTFIPLAIFRIASRFSSTTSRVASLSPNLPTMTGFPGNRAHSGSNLNDPLRCDRHTDRTTAATAHGERGCVVGRSPRSRRSGPALPDFMAASAPPASRPCR